MLRSGTFYFKLSEIRYMEITEGRHPVYNNNITNSRNNLAWSVTQSHLSLAGHL